MDLFIDMIRHFCRHSFQKGSKRRIRCEIYEPTCPFGLRFLELVDDSIDLPSCPFFEPTRRLRTQLRRYIEERPASEYISDGRGIR